MIYAEDAKVILRPRHSTSFIPHLYSQSMNVFLLISQIENLLLLFLGGISANNHRLQKTLCVKNQLQPWDLDRKLKPALDSLVLSPRSRAAGQLGRTAARDQNQHAGDVFHHLEARVKRRNYC